MSKISILLCLLVAILGGILLYCFAFDKSSDLPVVESKRVRNRFVHVFDDPKAAAQELEAAWKRFQAAQGAVVRNDGKPHGFSDQQIDKLESRMRQRLPADLKAFLKIYRSHGKWFNDLEFFDPNHVYAHWHERCSMGFGMDIANSVRYGGPNEGAPMFCEPCVLIFASEHLEEIGYDLRNGKIIEVMDCDAGWLANSLVELLDEMSVHIEQGKTISRYDWEIEELPNSDRYRKELLDSFMWHVYERPPEQKDSQ